MCSGHYLFLYSLKKRTNQLVTYFLYEFSDTVAYAKKKRFSPPHAKGVPICSVTHKSTLPHPIDYDANVNLLKCAES